MVGCRLPSTYKRSEEIIGLVGRSIDFAVHIGLVWIVKKIVLVRKSTHEFCFCIGLPCNRPVFVGCSRKLDIIVGYNAVAYYVQTTLVTGGEVGAVAVLRGTSHGFFSRGIAAIGHGDG